MAYQWIAGVWWIDLVSQLLPSQEIIPNYKKVQEP